MPWRKAKVKSHCISIRVYPYGQVKLSLALTLTIREPYVLSKPFFHEVAAP